MKYNKDKTEAVKILVSEILEFNQKMPEDRFADFRIIGGSDPKIDVTFWFFDENMEPDYNDDDNFQIYLTEKDWHKDYEQSFEDITKKMREWEGLFG